MFHFEDLSFITFLVCIFICIVLNTMLSWFILRATVKKKISIPCLGKIQSKSENIQIAFEVSASKLSKH